MPIIGFIIWLCLALFVIAAVLALAKAVLGLPAFAGLAPYTGVIYALIVVLVALALYAAVYGTGGFAPGALRIQ